MKYLDCIELLSLALKLLKDGQRDQVAVAKLEEVRTLVMSLLNRSPDLLVVQMKGKDLLGAITIAQSNKGVLNLPQSTRDILLQALHSCMADVCDAAWDYYSTNSFQPTDDTLPLFRLIVSYHYNRGA